MQIYNDLKINISDNSMAKIETFLDPTPHYPSKEGRKKERRKERKKERKKQRKTKAGYIGP